MLRHLLVFTVTAIVATSTNATLISQDLGAAAYSASGQYLSYAAAQAFDGSTGTNWNSGGYAIEWIEVDLGQAFDIAGLNLVVSQSPSGHTVHEIWLSASSMLSDLSGATLAHTFSGTTGSGDLLATVLASPVIAQYVQIRTTASPSWVSWHEIEVYDSRVATSVPEPATLGLIGLGLVGVGLLRRRAA